MRESSQIQTFYNATKTLAEKVIYITIIVIQESITIIITQSFS